MKKTVFCILLAVVLLMLLPMVAMAATTTVKYIDKNGVEQSHECIIMTSQKNYAFESNQWYAVISDVTIQERIENNAPVDTPAHLILADGVKLSASEGIHNPEGKELIIFGQKINSGELAVIDSESYNSGIGGNSRENGGTLTINGGKVVVKRGKRSGGAGIGGGYSKNGGDITINGGEVLAEGANAAAGIGGGGSDDGNRSYITINGGTVYANGGNHGAGIGGGAGSPKDSGSVIINGGNVYATGGLYGAGIGGGEYGFGVDVMVNGGKVVATGENAPGIGGTISDRLIFSGEFSITGGLAICAGNSPENATVTTASRYKSETRSEFVMIGKGTPYTVRHCLQTTDGTGYELKESEFLYGIVSLNTDAKAKEYDGFTSGNITQKSVAEDGTTDININYNRNTYTVRFVSDLCSAPDLISARYGSEVNVDAGPLSAAGYVFNGWYEDESCTKKFDMPQTITMPSHDITFYAGWTANSGTPDSPLPKTGDQTNLTLLTILLLASMGTLLLVSPKTRK